MAAPLYRHLHRVTYAECTVGNHLYYARYLNLLEEARGEFFRSAGAPFLKWQQEAGVIFPVIECSLKYKAPARYDDLLAIELWLTALERIRLNFAYRILNPDGALVLEAATLHICANLEEKPKRLPEDFIDRFSAYLLAPAQKRSEIRP